jgi:hypothetical protein
VCNQLCINAAQEHKRMVDETVQVHAGMQAHDNQCPTPSQDGAGTCRHESTLQLVL